MKIGLKTKNLDITPSFREYVEEKLGSLAKFLETFEKEGISEINIMVERATAHHRKGEVFTAKADLRLPGDILRAEEESEDARAAVDGVRDKLQLEIKKYKTKRENK